MCATHDLLRMCTHGHRYKRKVVGGMKHEEKWVRWHNLAVGKELPPWSPPAEQSAKKFYRVDLHKPLQWLGSL